MRENKKLKLPAKDLAKGCPWSARETLAGYVIAARMRDKCRAVIVGTAGVYHFDSRPVNEFLGFAGIDAGQFKTFVATGAMDDEVASWISTHALPRPRLEIIKWNNRMRDLRLSDLPDQAQEFLEAYLPEYLPKGRVVYRWFDDYDIEEMRL